MHNSRCQFEGPKHGDDKVMGSSYLGRHVPTKLVPQGSNHGIPSCEMKALPVKLQCHLNEDSLQHGFLKNYLHLLVNPYKIGTALPD